MSALAGQSNMAISFQCSKCQARMTVPDSLAGKRGKCKNCQTPMVVPTPSAPQAVKTGGPAPLPPPPPPKKAEAPVEDIESLALEALADPKEEVRQPQEIEFECPQCSESVKVPLEMAGKRMPCPSCRRIVPVPVPAKKDPANWRDTGPKLPEGAKREQPAAIEGAWGAGNAAGLSEETLEEAGLIKEKDRPLTLYQRFETPILIAVPTVLLLAAGWFLWSWWASSSEQAAYNEAMKLLQQEKDQAPGTLAAFKGKLAEYLLLRKADDQAAPEAAKYLKEAVGHAKNAGELRDALLLDLVDDFLRLGGNRDESDRGHRLSWDDTQRELRKCLEAFDGKDARLLALRRAAAGLVRVGQTDRTIAFAIQVSAGSSDADRAEMLSVVGLELFAAGEKNLAARLADQALALYAPKKKKGKEEATALRGPVVALAIVTEKAPPPPKKANIIEEEQNMYGHIEGLVLAGKADEARSSWQKGVVAESKYRAAALLASLTRDKGDIDAAIAARARAQEDRIRGLDWPQLRLLRGVLKADAGPDQFDKIVAAVEAPALREWAKLAVLRHKLKGSRSVVEVEALEGLSAKSPPGLLARLELARHNVALSAGWTSRFKEWDAAGEAFGWLGAALAMRGE